MRDISVATDLIRKPRSVACCAVGRVVIRVESSAAMTESEGSSLRRDVPHVPVTPPCPSRT